MAESCHETTGERQRHLARWRNRLAAGVALTALASALAVAATPVAAQAGSLCSASGVTCIPCPTAQVMAEDGLAWYNTGYGVWLPGPAGHGLTTPATDVMQINSYAPTFLVSQEKVVENPSSAVVTATFTSTTSQTFTLTESLSIASGTNSTENGFAQTLSETIGVTFAVSYSTSVGVNAAVSVPPDTEVIGEYGVPGYNVSYQLEPVEAIPNGSMTEGGTSLPAGSSCPLGGNIATGTATAPEPIDGWLVNNPQPIT
jgi:hypothetical protein